jgi:hypothetical protein
LRAILSKKNWGFWRFFANFSKGIVTDSESIL